MHLRSARAARVICLVVPLCALLASACQATPSSNDPAPAPTTSAAAAQPAGTAGAVGPTVIPANGVTREALCARATDCYIEVAKKIGREQGDTTSVDAKEQKLRDHQSKRCMAATEKATPDEMAGCMQLSCEQLLPCVPKLGKLHP